MPVEISAGFFIARITDTNYTNYFAGGDTNYTNCVARQGTTIRVWALPRRAMGSAHGYEYTTPSGLANLL